MPNWKKVIVSGSDASLTDVTIDDWGSVSASLAFINSAASLADQNLQEVTDNGASTTNNVTVNGLTVSNMPAGTDNSVVVRNTSGQLVTDEIDSRVWGSSLVDKTGTPQNNQLAIFTDANTIEGEQKLQFASSILSVNSTNSDVHGLRFYGGVNGSTSPYISPIGFTTVAMGSAATGFVFDFRRNKISFDDDSTNTYIQADSATPENLEIHADGDIELRADNDIVVPSMGTGTDNSVVIKTANNELRTDEIDSRVWGSSLVDKTGTPVDNQVAVFRDADTIEGDSNLTWDGNEFNIQGVLVANEKNFDIKHPTKEGWRLRYSVLEGPERGVYVRGQISGSTTIELPDYWSGLVYEDSISVQLTPVGSPCTHYVDTVTTSSISVGCQCGEVNAYYIIHAERKAEDPVMVEYQIEK